MWTAEYRSELLDDEVWESGKVVSMAFEWYRRWQKATLVHLTCKAETKPCIHTQPGFLSNARMPIQWAFDAVGVTGRILRFVSYSRLEEWASFDRALGLVPCCRASRYPDCSPWRDEPKCHWELSHPEVPVLQPSCPPPTSSSALPSRIWDRSTLLV